MNKKLSIVTLDELLRLRNLLQQVSQISFSFSKLNQNYPIENITEQEATELRHTYHSLLDETGKILEGYEEIYGKSTE